MNNRLLSRLTPVSFLQAFVIHSVNLWKKQNLKLSNQDNSIQYLGLSASSCFEDTVRKQLEFQDALTHDQYADVIIEIKNHPFFIGVQYHPEYKSTVANPHPIFVSFVAAMVKHKK